MCIRDRLCLPVKVSTADRVFGFATFDEEQRKLRLCEYREDRLLSRTEALLLQVVCSAAT
eukprot:1697228-Amphidinium_carterae.1